MKSLLIAFIRDDAGFIISAELVLVATIAVLSMVVGLSEIAHAVNQELEDVASAFGALNQTYRYNGLNGHSGDITGSLFNDNVDFCDNDCDIVAADATPEGW
ncbi:MAG: branched-chain amino acid aminotransferase [Planctomycetota bacterium]|nr:MAG: branched-chain amino acid aminotransferase [Planctomycetota bacterium]